VPLGERAPALDRRLACVVAGVCQVELSAAHVVSNRALRLAIAERRPRFSLGRVCGAADVGELCCRCVGGEAVEHAAWADRGELLAVADCDQLRSRALYQLGERVQPFVIGHAGLVEEDRRVGADVDRARVCSCDERVEGERASGERRAVRSQALGGRARDGDPDRLPSGVLLGAAASITTPLPVPAGPTSRPSRSGQ
jgi:hypothetical protein